MTPDHRRPPRRRRVISIIVAFHDYAPTVLRTKSRIGRCMAHGAPRYSEKRQPAGVCIEDCGEVADRGQHRHRKTMIEQGE